MDMNPKYISIFLCSLILGVGLGSIFKIDLQTYFYALLFAFILATVVLLVSKNFGLIIFAIIAGTAFGYWYVERSFFGNEYEEYLNQEIDTEGIVATDPSIKENGQVIILQPDGYTQFIRASPYTSNPEIKKGDRVWIRGEVQMPENFSGFDYIGYLQRYEVYAVLKKPRVIVLQRAALGWRTPLLKIRQYVENKTKIYSEAEGGLILGMLIGQQQRIPDDVKDAFKTTGLTHIVAVSGFNMTIIVSALGTLVVYLGRRTSNILSIMIVFGFVVITGASASVVRAAIMATLMVVAQLLGRQYASLYALLIVCSIMVLQNPRIVLWDIGFQLSVAATFGVLIAFSIRKPDAPQTFLGDTLRPTLGAIIMTAPIIAIHFGTFSVIAPMANLVVLPFVSWIMLFGALALLPVIGGAFVYPAELMTSLIIYFTRKFSTVPHASIDLVLPLWVWGIYYSVVVLCIIYLTKKQLPKPQNTGKL